jgi:hypothetical protein
MAKSADDRTPQPSLRLRFRTAAGVLILSLVGAGAASGSLSAALYIAKQTTTIRFSVSEKSHRMSSKGRELTLASGSGTLTLGETPQVNAVYHSTSANGTIVFHRWRIVAHHVIDEDNLTMNVVSGTYRFTKTTSTAVVQVAVTKTDPKESDNCPMGSTGELGILDGRIAAQPDALTRPLRAARHRGGAVGKWPDDHRGSRVAGELGALPRRDTDAAHV